jgi:hypothetical protein
LRWPSRPFAAGKSVYFIPLADLIATLAEREGISRKKIVSGVLIPVLRDESSRSTRSSSPAARNIAALPDRGEIHGTSAQERRNIPIRAFHEVAKRLGG